MVCYAVPTIAAIVHYGMRRSIPKWKNNTHLAHLNILLLGGAIFGVIDHLWNGELFLIGDNIVMDLALGITITMAIFAIWAIMVVVDRAKTSKPVGIKQ